MEFNTGGTADSSNSGAMTGGTMASSMYKKGGGLKPIPKGNKGLPKLPKSVRNKMGYMAKGGGVGDDYISNEMYDKLDKITDWKIVRQKEHRKNRNVVLVLSKSGKWYKISVVSNGKEMPKMSTYYTTKQSAENSFNGTITKFQLKQGGGVGKSLKEKYANLNYQIQSADSGWIKNNSEKYENMISELRKLHEKIYGKGRISKMEWGGTAESSETGEFIGGENQSSMYARGGHVSKGEMVWKKLKSSDKIQFLYENFTPEITPRGQEILVGKAWNFLPKNVKIKFEAKYANVENYGEGGGTGVSSESGTTIGGENQSSMFENGGVSTGFTYDIGGL